MSTLRMHHADGANPKKALLSCSSGEFLRIRHSPLPRSGAESLAALVKNRDDRTYSAIPIAPDTAFRTRQKTLMASTPEEGELDLLVLAQERLPGAVVVGVEVLGDKRSLRVETHRAKRRVTEWQVTDGSGSILAGHGRVTKALLEARKLARASVTPADFHVRGVVTGEGGPNYATYRQVQTGRRVKLRITYVETTRKDPAPTGWLFFRYED